MVKVVENGRTRSLSKNDMAARKLMNKANQGDISAINLVMKENAKLTQDNLTVGNHAPLVEITPEALLRAAKRYIQECEEGDSDEET